MLLSGLAEDVPQFAFPSFLVLYSTRAGGQESMRRDALRPDASLWSRRAAEGQGGATWRRDQTRT